MHKRKLRRAGLDHFRLFPAAGPLVDRFGPVNPDFAGSAPPDAHPVREVLTVGQLNRAADEALQAGFPMVWVSGESSNFSRRRLASLRDALVRAQRTLLDEATRDSQGEIHDRVEPGAPGAEA